MHRDYPFVIEAIKKEVRDFDSLSLKEQICHLIKSPHLPDWLKSMRDTGFRQAFFTNCPTLPPVDENASLEIQYRLGENQRLEVSLEGIDLQALNHLSQDQQDRGYSKLVQREVRSESLTTTIETHHLRGLLSDY